MTRSTYLTLFLVTGSLLAGGTAVADGASGERDYPSGLGIGITAGAGVTGFSDSGSDDVAGVGGLWEVRATFGVDSPVALEAAYVGTAQSVDMPLVDSALLGNGLEAAVRVNLGTFNVQPFVVGGMGWTRYSVDVEGMDLDIRGDDDVLTVPAGAGISFYAGPAMVDIRGTYRFAFDDELIREEGDFDERESLDTWSATARVGFAF